MAEIYISTDVETDGPIPGPYSMLSLGSAACPYHDIFGSPTQYRDEVQHMLTSLRRHLGE